MTNSDLRERVVRVVAYQTSPKQPPGTTDRVVRLLCSDTDTDPAAVTEALADGVEAGRLLDWTDDGGSVWRYTVMDHDSLLRLHRWAGERGRRELAGRAYRRAQEVAG